uniref:E3 ubiquitin-protein ligase AMFR n=1 Tax=Romanomermis culicivorax TaxID=13658 RepID=A0A915IZF6_ROMCU
MPVINYFNFIHRLPFPSLRNYAGFSFVILSAVLYYSYDTVLNDENWQLEFKQKIVDQGLSETTRDWLLNSKLARVIYFMLTDQVCIWTVVNTACCALVLVGKLLQNVVFGRLRLVEHQQMRDRFWNFIFYKFVFVFGVMNVQFFDEVFLWSIWFAVSGFFYLLTCLAQDRYKYVASSPLTAKPSNLRILVFLSVILFCDLGLFGVGIIVTVKYGFNYGGFLLAECVVLLLRVSHGLVRYGTYFYDAHRRIHWEDRNTFVYYTDFLFELSILALDVLHHLHMLLWSNMFLSVASLVIVMQLKHLYQEIDRRWRRHKNYQRIAKYIDSKYPMASEIDLTKHDDKCAICWDNMKTARKLNCGHLFHNWCLHGWLEQDSSCPTCRTTLSINETSNVDQTGASSPAVDAQPSPGENLAPRRRLGTNHTFHFDGNRYARWLPSFSVEVTHNFGQTYIYRRNLDVDNSQLTRMVEQVREMFPHLTVSQIEQDLRQTGNVEHTVDNVLNNRLSPDENAVLDVGTLSSENETESEYESDNQSETAPNDQETPSTSGLLPLEEDSRLLLDDCSFLDDDFTTATAQVSSGGRFSKMIEEREVILDVRKRQLILEHRKKYLATPRALDLQEIIKNVQQKQKSKNEENPIVDFSLNHNDQSSSIDNNNQSIPIPMDDNRARRRMLYNASLRHLPPPEDH